MPAKSREYRQAQGFLVWCGFKYCPSCEEVKPTTEFGEAAKGIARIQSWCRPCKAVRNKKKPVPPDRKRKNYLKSRWGLSVEQWEALLAYQGGICAVCEAADPGTIHGWQVDHDHATDAIRGLLCHVCNSRVVAVVDSYPDLLAPIGPLADYLADPPYLQFVCSFESVAA